MTDAPIPQSLPDAQLNPNARTVLSKRYLVKDRSGEPVERPEDMFWRVASVVAAADRRYGASTGAVQALAEEFYLLMTQRRFEPNSPTLMNAGRPLGQLSACFVLPVEDALSNGQNGIYDTLRSMALIHQSGGGTGFSFSRLRSKGAMVRSTTGVASGPISFMELYDASTNAVKQGGTRRGANMGILRVDHPDVLDFISCKEDLNKITNFNISVGVTASFMEAVKAGTMYDLIEPSTGQSVAQLDARMVWEKMIDGAWRTGEPGCFFIDEANRYNPVPHIGPYEATNPCVTADTWVHTGDGPRQVQELVGLPFEVLVDGCKHPTAPQGFFRTGTKETVRVMTREGFSLRLTADHKLRRVSRFTRYAKELEWCAAGELQPGDLLALHDHRSAAEWQGDHGYEQGYLVGLLVGDGTLKADAAVLSVWPMQAAANGTASGPSRGVSGVMQHALEAAATLPHRGDFHGWYEVKGRGGQRMKMSALRDLAFELGMRPGAKDITPLVERTSSDFYRGFLRGFFDADGSVQGTQAKGVSVRLSQSDLSRLEAVQRMLLRLGIVSTVCANRREAGAALLPDGKGGQLSYPTRAQHELIIAGDNILLFAERIGFADSDKSARLQSAIGAYSRAANRERFVATVSNIEPVGQEDVYDVQVPGVNAFDANGIWAHNCGEQPLLPYDVCNLGSINVGFYVRDGVMDWDAMKSDVHLATRFLDNIIDVNKYPLPEIDALSKRIRRIGFGVMGFADALVRLGIPYNSPEGIEFGRTLQEFVDTESKRESERLASQRGAFPEWARSIWGPDETCARDARGERIRPMQLLRNCNVTTVAPTGTISIIAGCSSGIEPLFAVAFMRNQAGVMMPDVNDEFVAVAKREGWYSDDLIERIAKEGHIHFAEVPKKWQRVFVTAHDIAPEWHVRMQAAFQENCDSAISKTTNFPHAASRDDVRAIYELAYDLKCKGVTVYRDGSRDNQVLSTGATAQAAADRDGKADRRELGELQGTIAEMTAEIDRLKQVLYDAEAENLQRRAKRSRPDRLRSTSIRKETPLGTMFVHITEDDLGQAFEVFITLGKAGGSAMADAEAMGRLISLALRSGIPIRELHKQLRGISSDRAVGLGANKVLSVPDAIGIALEEWMREKQGVQQDLLAPGGVHIPPTPVTPQAARPNPDVPGTGQQGQMAFDVYTGGEQFMQTCPDCGSQLELAEGCAKCHVCGFSECG